jgi:hypothetical protein
VDGIVQIQVQREYHYPRANQKGEEAKHKVHRLKAHTLMLLQPDSWHETWYALFDMASAIERSGPAQSHWHTVISSDVDAYTSGAVEMMAWSIASELGFDIIPVQHTGP